MAVGRTHDAVTYAMADQQTPSGYYKLDRKLGVVARQSSEIGCCAAGVTGSASRSRTAYQQAKEG
ncbi:hypothetical protein WEI85_05940 [Actinomycetes bacterium KLBMP 9797]